MKRLLTGWDGKGSDERDRNVIAITVTMTWRIFIGENSDSC